MKSRSLKLRRESLAELTSDDLGSVHGGQQSIICIQMTQDICPSYNCTGYYPSLNAPCTGTD